MQYSRKIGWHNKFKTGDAVRYIPRHAKGNQNHSACENGIVTSIDEYFVFVRFDGDIQSMACNENQLVRGDWS